MKNTLKCGIAAVFMMVSVISCVPQPEQPSPGPSSSISPSPFHTQNIEPAQSPEISPDSTPVVTMPPAGKKASVQAVYYPESFSYTPPEDMEIEEIAYHLVEQVMEYVSGYHEECSYEITDYEIMPIDDLKWDEEEKCWVCWPGIKLAWTGWYGIWGAMPKGRELFQVGDSDTGLGRVKIVEENGVYTLTHWFV